MPSNYENGKKYLAAKLNTNIYTNIFFIFKFFFFFKLLILFCVYFYLGLIEISNDKYGN